MAAGADPTVRMPGIVLSALMFQHLNSDSDVVSITMIPLKRILYYLIMSGSWLNTQIAVASIKQVVMLGKFSNMN